ncbi:hypothetical protein SAMN04488136_11652 [Vibrio xiamenensis]|uniref:DUF7683 domain-containing protein n=1 Tax=Vibrio xiamenensis TaxID=861298 RepID=A0A1G8CG81_9VIBR|nr:hypothetical protein [Vibrio xiamenensis]SDH44461.1 hypothetical protein SAMN04488136_11652 [Vibrio xiamenensis]
MYELNFYSKDDEELLMEIELKDLSDDDVLRIFGVALEGNCADVSLAQLNEIEACIGNTLKKLMLTLRYVKSLTEFIRTQKGALWRFFCHCCSTKPDKKSQHGKCWLKYEFRLLIELVMKDSFTLSNVRDRHKTKVTLPERFGTHLLPLYTLLK